MAKKKNQALQFICYFVGIVVALVLTYFIKTINQHITQEIQNADAVLTEASKVNRKKKTSKSVAPIPQQKETAFVEEPEEETTPSPNSPKADKKKIIYEFPLKDVNLLQ